MHKEHRFIEPIILVAKGHSSVALASGRGSLAVENWRGEQLSAQEPTPEGALVVEPPVL